MMRFPNSVAKGHSTRLGIKEHKPLKRQERHRKYPIELISQRPAQAPSSPRGHDLVFFLPSFGLTEG
jgi:hypothetical protein